MGSAIEKIIVKHKEPTMTFLNKYKSGVSSNLSCIVLPLYYSMQSYFRHLNNFRIVCKIYTSFHSLTVNILIELW